MKHFKQRHNECALAAACAASELDYPQVSDSFRRKHGELTFGDFTSVRSGHKECVLFLTRITGRSGLWISHHGPFTSLDDYTPNLKGRGILALTLLVIPKERHAVAYENGVIYDSDLERPWPFEIWRGKRISDFYIDDHIVYAE